MSTPYKPVDPMMIYRSADGSNIISLRLKNEVQPQKAIQTLETIFKKCEVILLPPHRKHFNGISNNSDNVVISTSYKPVDRMIIYYSSDGLNIISPNNRTWIYRIKKIIRKSYFIYEPILSIALFLLLLRHILLLS